MKNIIKTLILSILVLITAMSTACTQKASADTTEEPATFGTHILTAPEVEDERYIMKDGEFLYTLVVSSNATSREKVAKDEFVLLLKRATGIVASVISDDLITEYNPDSKYISIGQTKLLDMAGISIDTASLKTNGVRIITKDNNIFLAGGVADGAMNAVYDFFQICFDFEWYSRNLLYINENVTNLKLRQFDVTDVPDINTQQITYGPTAKSSDTLSELDKKGLASDNLTVSDLLQDLNNKSNRSRYAKPGRSTMFTATGKKVLGGKTTTYGSQHNILNIFSEFEEGMEKDKWWADSRNQLCWTAHGDEASYQRMVDFAVNRVISYFKQFPPSTHPEMSAMMFGVEDGGQACKCAECEYRLEMDGARSGASIRFVRLVCDKLREWLDQPENAEWYREEFKIVIFAYGEVKEPPTHKNSKGEWVVNEGLFEGMEDYRDTMFKDLVVWKCFQGPAHLDITSDAPEITSMLDEYKAWGAIFENMYSWNYGELYLNKTFYQDFTSRWNTNFVKFYHDLGVDHMLTELCSSGEVVTRWGDLTYYLITKLSWNGNLSSTELITKFMKASFGPAAETMEKLFYAQKMNLQKAADIYYERYGSQFGIGKKKWDSEEYPYEVIKTFIDYIEQAYVDIESLKVTDPVFYDVVKDKIDIEGIAHYYELTQLYNGNEKPYTPEQKATYKKRAIELLQYRSMSQLTLNTFLTW